MSPFVIVENSDKVQRENDGSTTENIVQTWNRLSKIIVWTRFTHFTLFHLGFIVALSSYIFGLHSVSPKGMTWLWTFFYGTAASFGITAGAHRMWSHRCFKAKLPLRVFLMILYSTAGVYSLRVWIRDHRQHHRFTDTDSDPHNATRGLFYSHIGWLVTKRTKENFRTRSEIDMSDIHADPVVMFQDKYCFSLPVFFCFVLPTAIPVIFWDETIMHAILTQCFIRYICHLHMMFSVNSIAHYWSYRPYNRSFSAADNPLINMLTYGEGTHNYHHAFPWDYKATEFPFANFNFTSLSIRALAALGLAYDLREPSPELVQKVKERYRHGNDTLKNKGDR